MVDCEENVERHFSLSELRELFNLKTDTLSDTHDKYVCYLFVCLLVLPINLVGMLVCLLVGWYFSFYVFFFQKVLNQLYNSMIRLQCKRCVNNIQTKAPPEEADTTCSVSLLFNYLSRFFSVRHLHPASVTSLYRTR